VGKKKKRYGPKKKKLKIGGWEKKRLTKKKKKKLRKNLRKRKKSRNVTGVAMNKCTMGGKRYPATKKNPGNGKTKTSWVESKVHQEKRSKSPKKKSRAAG